MERIREHTQLESCVRAAESGNNGDCKKEFGVSVMASERGTERLERGRRQNIYQKDTGKSGCTFPYFETASNCGSLLLIWYVSWGSSPKEFAPTNQTFTLRNGSGMKSDLVFSVFSTEASATQSISWESSLIFHVGSISGQTAGTKPNRVMKT